MKRERAVYHLQRKWSSLEPEKYLSIIIDGMDQKKTHLPWIWPSKKFTSALLRLKTHITGVKIHGHKPEKLFFVDFCEIPHDPNLTCHVIRRSLLSLNKPPPPVLFLQLDNTSRENKNWTVLTSLAMLVFLGAFEEVYVSFLLVGHTHEDIDALFSRIAEKLRKHL